MFVKNILKISVFFLSFFLVFQVFADSTWFKVDSKELDSVNFSWEKNEKSPYAQIFYSDKSSENWAYENETDLIEWNTYKISDLVWNKTYYFKLKLMNSEWVEVATSDEISTKISASWKSANFKLVEVKQVWPKEIKLSFSNNLLDTQTKEDLNFKIESISNPSDFFEVVAISIPKDKKNEINLTLDSEPKDSTDYKVVALTILDENSNNIEFWVDSEASFIWGFSLDSAWPTEEKTPEIKEVEEKKDEPKVEEKNETPKKTSGWVSGQDINPEDIKKDVSQAAEDKEKLPKTWPEHFILLFLALIIGTAVFIPRYRK